MRGSDSIHAPGKQVGGVLYEISDEFIRGSHSDGQKTLEKIEGPRYTETTIRVHNQEEQEMDALTLHCP
jgi:hypothetical protein